MMKKILNFVSFLAVAYISVSVSFGDINPFLKGSKSGAVDIGVANRGHYIEVPFTKMYFPPTMKIVKNVVIYSNRVNTIANCIVDKNNEVGCPLEQKECQGNLEYTTGNSVIGGTGNISCSTIDPVSYFDRNKNKCVLPASKSNVCNNDTYNPVTDKCMRDYRYSAPSHQESTVRTSTYKLSWWWLGLGEGNFREDLFPVIQAAGGTRMDFTSVWRGGIPGYFITTDITRPITIIVNFTGTGWYYWLYSGFNKYSYSYSKTYNPGDQIFLPIKGISFSDGGYVTITFIYNYTAYSCQPGETLISNGGSPLCSGTMNYEPQCKSSIFNQRSGDQCMTDIKHYKWYNYQCPADVNKYGNAWHPLNAGGDCGGGPDGIDIDGDGIKDFCNSSTPPTNNCYRTYYTCGLNPNNPCVFMEKDMDYNDFSKWSVINLSGNTTDSNWNVISSNSVNQVNDTNPSFFLSNYSVQDNGKIYISGTVKVNNTTDNDWLGFVFGFKGTNDFYLLDWSKKPNDLYNTRDAYGNYINRDSIGNPTNGAIPLTLSKIKSIPSANDLWSHLDNSSISVLKRSDNGGWVAGQEYNVRLEIDPHEIKVYIGKAGEAMSLNMDYTSVQPIDVAGKLGFYNYSLSNTTYKDFLIQWENGESVKSTTKQPLTNHGGFVGSFKGEEYGNELLTRCAADYGICNQSMTSMVANGKNITFSDKQGVEGTAVFDGDCTFEGQIKEHKINNKLLLSFLNSPSEATGDARIENDYTSPTKVALNLNDLPGYIYPLKQVKESAKKGDQITVDFWLNWRGDPNGLSADVPIGFYYYDIWISSAQNKAGFSTTQDDVYGIGNASSVFENKWTRITAVFTHQDLKANKLYVNGAPLILSEQTANTVHDDTRADITKILNLGGITGSPNYSINAKVAGVNVYDGALSDDDIKNMYSSGNRGINRLDIHGNKITGYNSRGQNLGTITSSCLLQGKVGYIEDGDTSQIVSAKAINGRLEFWDSFNMRGNIGFIEAIKTVDPTDAANGYMHEYTSFRDLYNMGFTGFKTVGGNTYAVSYTPMDIPTCINTIKGTGYYLAEKTSSDLEGISAINSLSYYISGEYKDHCVIEKNTAEDNIASKYAVKTVIKQKTKGHFVCSPFGCNSDYKCGYASCPADTNGAVVREADKAGLPANTCYGQKCDFSKPYFPYCGNPNSCDTADPSVMKTTDGKCMQASCPDGSSYNTKLGQCEKLGCKYETKDNKCYKKVY